MSGFEVIEDMLAMEEIMRDKRKKENQRFLAAENLIIFDEFYNQRYLKY